MSFCIRRIGGYCGLNPLPERLNSLEKINRALLNAQLKAPNGFQGGELSPECLTVQFSGGSVSFSDLVLQINILRPDILDLTYDSEYLQIARKIVALANSIFYSPPSPYSGLGWLDCFFTLTPNSATREIFRDGRMSPADLRRLQNIVYVNRA